MCNVKQFVHLIHILHESLADGIFGPIYLAIKIIKLKNSCNYKNCSENHTKQNSFSKFIESLT